MAKNKSKKSLNTGKLALFFQIQSSSQMRLNALKVVISQKTTFSIQGTDPFYAGY